MRILLIVMIVLMNILATSMQLVLNNVCNNYTDYATIDFNDKNCWSNPDYGSSTIEIIKNHNYDLQSHQVITEDGYILSLLRILSRDANALSKGVVLLQHGILTNSICWVTFGSRSIAFQLVDLGYDVWLGNSRGSELSLGHINESISKSDYWSFSFHEMGIYDIPAVINHITGITGSSAINYIGHSMGATQSFIYASEFPQHASTHLTRIVTLAPIAYLSNKPQILQFLADNRNIFERIARLFGINLFDLSFFKTLARTRCRYYPDILMCVHNLFGLFGAGYSRLPPSDAPIFLQNYASTAPVNCLIHYAQFIGDRLVFRPFDYDLITNQRLYNATTPPEYKLDRIELPVHLFYNSEDPLTSSEDTLSLFNALRNSPNKTILEIPTDPIAVPYSHVDFLLSEDLKSELVPHILEAMRMQE